MALGLEKKNYVPVLGGASIVVALAVITANTVLFSLSSFECTYSNSELQPHLGACFLAFLRIWLLLGSLILISMDNS